jgi:hypothetical protein
MGTFNITPQLLVFPTQDLILPDTGAGYYNQQRQAFVDEIAPSQTRRAPLSDANGRLRVIPFGLTDAGPGANSLLDDRVEWGDQNVPDFTPSFGLGVDKLSLGGRYNDINPRPWAHEQSPDAKLGWSTYEPQINARGAF